MKVLALDTSSDACSVALQVDERVMERHEEMPREHTRLLMPMIESLLRDHKITLADLDTIVLGNGPGSFIGMRIGAAVAQGMAFGAGLKLIPVSSLAAIAAEAMQTLAAKRVLVAQDARMGDVYLATFAADDLGVPVAVGEAVLHKASEPVGHYIEGDTIAAGAGWDRCPELGEAARTSALDVAEIRFPRARFLLPGGLRDWQAGKAIRPEQLEPEYVRTQVARIPAA